MRRRDRKPGQRDRRRGGIAILVAVVLAGGCGTAALGYVGFLLRPQWPAAAPAGDAPTIPITIGGLTFNVPPAAIRFPPQRHPGAQPRLDLAFQWPRLIAPEPQAKVAPSEDLRPVDHLFVSIATPSGSIAAGERIKTIYPRYLAPEAFAGPEGLSGVAFRDGTPYQGEDLLFDLERPDHFIVRCTRATAEIPGACLLERQLGPAELTVRFPREWLADWQELANGVERLLASLRAAS